jgi:hypothetical protein
MRVILFVLSACGHEEPVAVDDHDEDDDGHRWEVDCDDHDPEVFPGAMEVCDGKDNDCDRQVDCLWECSLGLDPSCALEQLDVVGGASRGGGVATGDATADGNADLWIGATTHSVGLELTPQFLWFEGPISAEVIDETDALATVAPLDSAALVETGDFDSDGLVDLLMVQEDGVVRGFLAPFQGAMDEADFRLSDSFFDPVILLDADDDGVTDLLGRSQTDPPGIALILGPLPDKRPIANVIETGEGGPYDAGDVTGDGIADVLIFKEGLHLVVGPLAEAAGPAEGAKEEIHLLRSVDIVEDLNGDGYRDVLAGAPSSWDVLSAFTNGVVVYLGPLTSLVSPAAYDLLLQDDGSEGIIGASLSTIGDLTGDGSPEIAVDERTETEGRVRIVSLHWLQPGGYSLEDETFRLLSDPDAFGETVLLFGVDDLTGDGKADLLWPDLVSTVRVIDADIGMD